MKKEYFCVAEMNVLAGYDFTFGYIDCGLDDAINEFVKNEDIKWHRIDHVDIYNNADEYHKGNQPLRRKSGYEKKSSKRR